MSIPQFLIFALVIVVAVWMALRLLRRWIGGALLRSVMADRPRLQHVLFVRVLRDFVFKNPSGARKMLCSQNADVVVRKLWDDRKPPPIQRLGGPSLPADGLSVHHGQLSDGRPIALISLPPPQRKGEAYLVAVVFPTDAMLSGKAARSRALTRFFYLNRGSSQTGRETDLCGWTADGHERWYNVGAPTDPERFAVAIDRKLHELKL